MRTGSKTSLTLPKTTGGTDAVITLSDKTELGYVPDGTGYLLCATNGGGTPDKWYVYNSSAGGSVQSAATKLSVTTCK